MTVCTGEQLEFEALGKREVIGRFDGGAISSDGGAMLLAEVEKKTEIAARVAECFVDYRDPALVEHTVRDLVTQRIFTLAMGYEDLNDHDRLRLDPLLAAAIGKLDPTGAERIRERDRGKALASSSTLNRLELTPEQVPEGERYKKIAARPDALKELFVQFFLEAFPSPPDALVFDLDATDDPIHGMQEGRFFHGYYDGYCYLPLYIFCGRHLLWAELRSSCVDPADGSIEALAFILALVRRAWPKTAITIRADAGFCREDLMAWCEANDVDFVFGFSQNPRLLELSLGARVKAQTAFIKTGEASRVFADFDYRTRKSWSRSRRVVVKAEYLRQGPNPRFVVTSLRREDADPRTVYEDIYCARGDMENRIKEQQLDLFADRTSSHTMYANQLRLYFSSFAYVLLCALRRLGLSETELENAQCGTIRDRLLKVGAQIRVTVRKVWISFSESFPLIALFRTVLSNIRAAPVFNSS